MSAILTVTDLEGDLVGNLDIVTGAPDVQTENPTIREIYLPEGWSTFHINAPVGTIKGVNLQTGAITTLPNQHMSTILMATVHKQVDGEWVPLSTSNTQTDFYPTIQLVKNNAAAVWFVEFAFDGIQTIENFQGYQIKVLEPLKIAYVGDNHSISGSTAFPALNNTLGGIIPLQQGWNMIGFPGVDNPDGPAYLSLMPIIEDDANNNNVFDKIIIIKNYEGVAVLPEFGFFGFNSVSTALGYQIKTTQACNLIVSSSLNYGIINFTQPPLTATDIDNGDNANNDDVDDQVVTDTTMNFTFLADTIKELTTTLGFVGTSGITNTFSNLWGLAIEQSLYEMGVISEYINNLSQTIKSENIEFEGQGPSKVNIFDLFLKGKLQFLLSEILFALNEKIVESPKQSGNKTDNIEKNFNTAQQQLLSIAGKLAPQVVNDITGTPGYDFLQKAVSGNELFFKKSTQITIQNLYKQAVENDSLIYRRVITNLKNLHNLTNVTSFNRFLFYNQSNFNTLRTAFGQSKNIDYFSEVSCKLFGDDPLEAGVQGFANNENIHIAFNLTEGINTMELFDPRTNEKVGELFMGKVRNIYKEIIVDYTGGYSYNGKYSTNTSQVVKDILKVNHKEVG